MKIYLRGCALSILSGILVGGWTFATTPDQGIRANYPMAFANFVLVAFSGVAVSAAVGLWIYTNGEME